MKDDAQNDYSKEWATSWKIPTPPDQVAHSSRPSWAVGNGRARPQLRYTCRHDIMSDPVTHDIHSKCTTLINVKGHRVDCRSIFCSAFYHHGASTAARALERPGRSTGPAPRVHRAARATRHIPQPSIPPRIDKLHPGRWARRLRSHLLEPCIPGGLFGSCLVVPLFGGCRQLSPCRLHRLLCNL